MRSQERDATVAVRCVSRLRVRLDAGCTTRRQSNRDDLNCASEAGRREQDDTMAASTGAKTGFLRLLTASLSRRPAGTAAVLSSAAAVSGRSAGTAALRTSAGSGRLAVSARRLGALHGAAVVCSASIDDGLVEVQLKVDGMVCDGCSSRVEETLQKMAGVKKVHVDLDKGLATVQVEAVSQIDAFNAVKPLAEAIKGLGFEAEPHFAEAEHEQ